MSFVQRGAVEFLPVTLPYSVLEQYQNADRICDCFIGSS
jgi:hypothetical protein